MSDIEITSYNEVPPKVILFTLCNTHGFGSGVLVMISVIVHINLNLLEVIVHACIMKFQ